MGRRTLFYHQHYDYLEIYVEKLKHKQSTADKYYELTNRGKSAVQTSNQLSRIMRNVSEQSSDTKKDADEAVNVSGQKTLVSVDVCNRHKWSVEEEEAMKSLFSAHIKNGMISIVEVSSTSKH